MMTDDEQLLEDALAAVASARKELSRSEIAEELVRDLWARSLGLDMAPGAPPPCTTELIEATAHLRSGPRTEAPAPADGVLVGSWGLVGVVLAVGMAAGIVIGGTL